MALFDKCYLLPVFTSARENKNIKLDEFIKSSLNYPYINFNDIKSNPEIYREILEKCLQILTLSSERILNKSDLLCVH